MTEFLTGLDRLPEDEVLEAWRPTDSEATRQVSAVAAGDVQAGVWGRIAAVRLLARVGGPVASEALARVLGDCLDPEDRLAAEALVAVESVGLEALVSLVQVLRLKPPGRELAVEAALRLVAEYQASPAELEALRAHLECRFLHAKHSEDRELYAGYLGDLGDPAALPTLKGAVTSPHLGCREYEALRESIERLGEECPEIYFDAEGDAYPVDEEGALRCAVCGAALRLDGENGRPVHGDGTPGRH